VKKQFLFRLAAILVSAGVSFAQTAPKITVTPPDCIPPVEKDTNQKITANIDSANAPTSVRVYFHAEGDLFFHAAQGRGLKKEEQDSFFKDPKGQVYFHPPYHGGDHYHEMKKGDGGVYWSMLPKVAPGTTGVVYYIEVRDADGHATTSPPFTVPVKPDCPAPDLSSDEKKYAKNLVEGLTAERQSAVPPGFLCDGIVSFITSSGDLKANEECRKCSCGFFPVEWVAGAALVGGGVVIYNNNHGGGGGKPVSPYRP
jgi:hypothetical protein